MVFEYLTYKPIVIFLWCGLESELLDSSVGSLNFLWYESSHLNGYPYLTTLIQIPDELRLLYVTICNSFLTLDC